MYVRNTSKTVSVAISCSSRPYVALSLFSPWRKKRRNQENTAMRHEEIPWGACRTHLLRGATRNWSLESRPPKFMSPFLVDLRVHPPTPTCRFLRLDLVATTRVTNTRVYLRLHRRSWRLRSAHAKPCPVTLALTGVSFRQAKQSQIGGPSIPTGSILGTYIACSTPSMIGYLLPRH